MSMNLFEFAVRNKLRFDSSKGQLTVEQLFDVPLTARGAFSLNAIAQTIDAELNSSGVKNFVQEGTEDRKRKLLEKKLAVVVAVIEDLKEARTARYFASCN